MIYVTRPLLPPAREYGRYLKGVWRRHRLTNSGPLHNELEEKLAHRLGTDNLVLVANGTLALQLAFKALGLKGEVVTTPFTFAASANALVWEGLTPIFADIDPNTLNVDPASVEKRITKQTSAILAVHVFGNPCDVEALGHIAKKKGIRLIFDAAHAFGVEYAGRPILSYGDASALSFHATKVFHTIEGGGVAVQKNKEAGTLRLLRNFGIAEKERVLLPGINAKMNEFQAAMGLCNLKLVENEIAARRERYELYKELLKGVPSVRFQSLTASRYNYSYMPVLIAGRGRRDVAYDALRKRGVMARKYFFPLVSDAAYFRIGKRKRGTRRSPVPVAAKVAHEVLCLPLYGDLPLSAMRRIAHVVRQAP